MSKLDNLTIVIPCHVDNEKFQRSLHNSQWANVLVIDQNSGIDWKKLSKNYEFDVFEYPHLKSFSEMKNTALSKVKTEWVFFLDSDEWCSPELIHKIKQVIDQNEAEAFAIKRIDYFLGDWVTHGEIANQLMVRIGKTKKVKWSGVVHERLELNNDSSVQRLKEPLYHEPHDSIADFIDSVNQYTTQEAQTNKKESAILKSIIWPKGKFIWNYIFRLGFLDGWRGLSYCIIMSLHSNAVRVKRYES